MFINSRFLYMRLTKLPILHTFVNRLTKLLNHKVACDSLVVHKSPLFVRLFGAVLLNAISSLDVSR